MSLINQMLKDLEARSAPQLDEHDDTIRGITWTMAGKTRKTRRHILLIVTTSIVCTGLAAASYYRSNSSNMQTAESNQIETDKSNRDTEKDVAPIQAQPVTTEKVIPQKPAPGISSGNIENNRRSQLEPSQVRKMLAALVAQGALSTHTTQPHVEADKVLKRTQPIKHEIPRQKTTLVKPELVMAKTYELAENTVKQTTDNKLTKKLLPLNNNKLAEMAYQEGYEDIARGQEQAGEIKLKRALDLQSKHSKAREMLAVLYLQQQRVNEAGEILTQGIRLLPEHYAFREIYARVLMAQKKIPEAIAMLKAVSPVMDERPNYYALLAGLYQQNKQFEDAASLYLQLIKKKPQYSHWWLGMAIALENMGKNREAISAYKKARDLNLPAKLMSYVNSHLQKLGYNDVADQ